MKQHPIPKRLGALWICFALLAGLLPTAALAADGDNGFSWTLSGGPTNEATSGTDVILNKTLTSGNLTVSGGSGKSITVTGEGTVNVTLSGNITSSGDISCESMATLNITSGNISVDGSISSQDTINISGGHVTASSIAMSGTVNGSSGFDLNITGGILDVDKITVQNSGTGPANFTVNGNSAVVFADTVSVSTKGTSSKNYQNGVVFEGTDGKVYGAVTLPDDVTIPEGYTLTIPSGSSLTVPSDTTLTNEGTITVESGGTFTNSGTINNYGTLSGNIEGTAPPSITTTSLTDGTVGAAYNATLAASGNPTSWNITGSLPAGLTLNGSTGEISGTPTADGTFNFTVKATNGGGSDSKPLSITINQAQDTTAPTLTAGSANRTGEATATVTFTSSEAGTYYYAVVERGATAPTIDTSGAGTACDTTEQTISLVNLTTGAKDIYIVVKDAAGNDSNKLKMEIPAYIAPSYGISVDPASLDFGSVNAGYTTAPAAQTVTITNTGNQSVTLYQPTAENYEIGTLTNTTLTPGAAATFTVQPKTGLAAGNYNETLAISGDHNTSASITVSFTVEQRSSGGGPTTYAVTAPDAENGTVRVSPSRASRGTTVTITVTPDEGYELENLTVLDSRDNEITLTDKGDGKYTFTMPAGRVTVEASFAEIAPEPLPFGDVDDGDWFADAVRFVYENGMMNGVSDTGFAPEAAASRGMIVTILYRLENEPDIGSGMDFADVAEGEWYAGAVAWAAVNGIVNGVSGTTFAPDADVTREQLAAILYRYAAYKGYGVTERADLSGFADAGDVSGYAQEALAWANAVGIVGGTSGTTLEPQGSATRAQAAAMLQRFCENIAAQ